MSPYRESERRVCARCKHCLYDAVEPGLSQCSLEVVRLERRAETCPVTGTERVQEEHEHYSYCTTRNPELACTDYEAGTPTLARGAPAALVRLRIGVLLARLLTRFSPRV